jgi:hypothetical protein
MKKSQPDDPDFRVWVTRDYLGSQCQFNVSVVVEDGEYWIHVQGGFASEDEAMREGIEWAVSDEGREKLCREFAYYSTPATRWRTDERAVSSGSPETGRTR